jgi:hypothetical protein
VALLGLTPADVAKTLVLRRSKGECLFAVLAGDTQLAWPKLRALVGVNKLSLPDAGEALTATGYARGTITPVGNSTTGRSTWTSDWSAAASRWGPATTATAPSSRSTIWWPLSGASSPTSPTDPPGRAPS